MTGRDLILYILQHDLENEPVFKDGIFIGFETDYSFATKRNVGVETIRALVLMKEINHIRIGDNIYIPATENQKLSERRS